MVGRVTLMCTSFEQVVPILHLLSLGPGEADGNLSRDFHGLWNWMYFPEERKEPLQAGPLVGLPPICTMCLLGGILTLPLRMVGQGASLQKVAPILADVLTESERLGTEVLPQESSLSHLLHSSKQSLPICPTSAGWSWKCPVVTCDFSLLLPPAFLA